MTKVHVVKTFILKGRVHEPPTQLSLDDAVAEKLLNNGLVVRSEDFKAAVKEEVKQITETEIVNRVVAKLAGTPPPVRRAKVVEAGVEGKE